MENVYYSLKDFELSLKKSAIERADDFQQYINQLNEFGCKSYWITSQTGVGSTMTIEGFSRPVTAFISNDYLGMSQREETKQAGIDAIIKYGTGACAAQVIGGYLDIHQQLEQEIASFVGQEDAMDAKMKELVFENGYVVEYEEALNVANPYPMTIKFAISAQTVKMDEATFVQDWPENN